MLAYVANLAESKKVRLLLPFSSSKEEPCVLRIEPPRLNLVLEKLYPDFLETD
jgi:hypothetical protein